MFLELLFRDPIQFLDTVVIIIVSITIHEWFHAVAALSQGDDTAARAGRLSLNPMVHMGVESIVMLVFFGLAWGQTPVNRSRFRAAWSPALVSFAGPFANLLLMVLSAWVMLHVELFHLSDSLSVSVGRFVSLAALLNGFLFLLNMLPLPPLDGFGVLETFLPILRRYSVSWSRYSLFILLAAFLFLGLGRFLSLGALALLASVTAILRGLP